MLEPDPTPTYRKGLRTTLAIAAVTGAGAVAFMLPAASQADPVPPPAPPPTTDEPAAPFNPLPVNPFAPPPPPPDANEAPADANAAPPPPPAAEPGRVNNAAGGLSFVVPAGWNNIDASRLTYGQALLTKAGAQGPATDSSIILGKLDMRLFAGAEPDNTKAAIRLASDMGEFFMPYPGTRINQEVVPLEGGLTGAASYYEVKFTDTNKPNGQIWAAAVGSTTPRAGRQPAQTNRWFVVWLGNANNPIDKGAAKALAQSIQPWAPPPPPEAPPPPEGGAPGAPAAPGAPPPGQAPGVGVPVPVNPETAPGMVPPS
jgi:Fibronectin-attachment protein (FAP)